MSNNKEISKTNESGFNFTPANFQEVAALAKHVLQSGLLGVRNQSEALVLMMIAQQEGKNLIQTCLDYNIIKGKPALTAQATLVRFQQSGGTIKYLVRNDKIVRIEFTHPSSGTLEVEWTIERAQQIRLASKDNWRNYPAAMLTARCVAEGVRALYPACLGGVYLVEEVQDFDVPKNNTQQNQNELKDNYSGDVLDPDTMTYTKAEPQLTEQPKVIEVAPQNNNEIKTATPEDVAAVSGNLDNDDVYDDVGDWDDDPMSPQSEWDNPIANDDDDQQGFKL